MTQINVYLCSHAQWLYTKNASWQRPKHLTVACQHRSLLKDHIIDTLPPQAGQLSPGTVSGTRDDSEGLFYYNIFFTGMVNFLRELVG